MLSFYGGPAGKDFSISKIFPNKKALDADLNLGLTSPIQPDDFVLISYGDPNVGAEFSSNLAADNGVSYNATLWQKEYNNGVQYKLVTSLISTYPTLIAGNISNDLDFGAAPQLTIDNSILASPKLGLKMPASLTKGSNNTVEMVGATEEPIAIPVYDGTLKNELSFQLKIPRGVTFTPSVSNDGIISWINDGNKTNPSPINIKGNKGDQGVSFAGIEYIPTSESGGENRFKVKFSNGDVGTEEYVVRNGIGIINAEETPSQEDNGENIVYFIKSDGTKIGPITIRNGSRGNTGGIKSIVASVTNTIGVPHVTAELTGDPSNADLNFTFENIKGEKGLPGTISFKEITVDTGSSEQGSPSCTFTPFTSPETPEQAIYSLAFHNLVGKQGERGLRGYYLLPAVDQEGNLSWTQKDGNVSLPATVNIRGPQGKIGDPLNIIANITVTSNNVPIDSLETVSQYLDGLGQNPNNGELIAVTYSGTDDTVYWYFKINGVWNRIQITGGTGGVIAQEKIEATDPLVTERVYSAAYINALEARIAALEKQLTIDSISTIKAGG